MRAPSLAISLVILAACARPESRFATSGQTATGTLAAALAQARQQAPEAEAQRIWADNGADASGAPSPDGKLLSYTDWSTLALGVRDLGTGLNRLLAREKDHAGGSGFPETSAFSNDGKRLAYRWINGTGHHLYVIDVAGSAPRLIVPTSPSIASIWPLEWTADDREILVGVTRPDRTLQLAFVNVSTGTLEAIRTFNWDEGAAGAGSATLSRDGRFLAMSMPAGSAPNLESDIVILTRDGSREISRLTRAGVEKVVGWGADGRLYYQWSDKATSQASSLYAVQMRDGRTVGEPQLVKSDMSRALYVRITASGRLFYGILAGSYDVYVAGIDASNASVIAPPARASHRLVGFNQGIDWTADGRSSAYLVREGAAPRSPGILAIRDQETGDVRELRPDLEYINPAIRWSPDGRSIVAQGNDTKGRHGLFLIDPNSGKTTSILFANPKGGIVHRPQWSPDGRAIYYSVIEPGKKYRIQRRELDSGAEREVYTAADLSPSFALSEDGATLAVVQGFNDGSVISLVPSGGGAARELLRVPGPDRVASITWSRDGKQILFATGAVWRVSVSGGPAQPIGLTMKSITGLRMHPDGRRLGFTGGEGQWEVWAMDTSPSSGSRAGSSSR